MCAGDGNGWVELPDGTRRWGLYGASGLLLHTADMTGPGHVLLQHRASWSHHGDTWGIPGGAIDSSESTMQAAMREFEEEVAGDLGEIVLHGVHRQDYRVWTYDTILARSSERRPFTPGSDETADIRWVPVNEIADLRLLPAFATIWPVIREALGQHLELIVDAASGSTEPHLGGEPAPGTNTGGISQLRDALSAVATAGIHPSWLPDGLQLVDLHRWFPRITLVTGDDAPVPPAPGVEVIPAGDQVVESIAEISRERGNTRGSLVVTAHAEVRQRLAALGASTAPREWLFTVIGGGDNHASSTPGWAAEHVTNRT